jgi:ketosteroid isomerase-like protein
MRYPVAFLITGILLISYPSHAQTSKDKADSLSVVQTMNGFLDAFTNLEWQKFSAYFAEEATAFFPPSSRFPFRANTKTEIETIFRKVFDNARKQKANAPYLDIQPKEMKIQLLGAVAIVTFLLDDPEFLGRRTLVLKKGVNDWKIVHLHASGAVRN